MLKKTRMEHAEVERSEFVPPDYPGIFRAGNVNRLPVLVSGDGVYKLFGVPKLASVSGYKSNPRPFIIFWSDGNSLIIFRS